MKLLTKAAVLAAALLGAGGAQSALVVMDWDISPDGSTLSFNLVGSIDVGAVIGNIGPDLLYIGVPSDTDWIVAQSTSRTIVNNGGGSVNVRTTEGNYQDPPTASGDYAFLRKDVGNWVAGDSVDVSVTMVGPALSLIAANVIPEDVIVSAGATGVFIPAVTPDPTNQVGAFGYVPNPASWALILVGIPAFRLARRRKLNKA